MEINSNNKNNLSLANYEQIFMYIWRLYNFMSHEHEYVCNVKMKCPTILDAYNLAAYWESLCQEYEMDIFQFRKSHEHVLLRKMSSCSSTNAFI